MTVVNFLCSSCGKRFSVVCPKLILGKNPNCYFCKSSDVARLHTKDLMKECDKNMKENKEESIELFSQEGRKRLLDLFYKDQLSSHHDKKTADETLSAFKQELEIINKTYYEAISVFLSNTLYAKLQDKHLIKPPWV